MNIGLCGEPLIGSSTEKVAEPSRGLSTRKLKRRSILVGWLAGCAWWAMPKGVAADDRIRFAVTVTDGHVPPEKQTLQVTEGDSVEIEFISNRGLELHLHGIDVELTLVPGRPSVMRFDAAHAGRFPVEAHGNGGHAVVIYVEVHPR